MGTKRAIALVLALVLALAVTNLDAQDTVRNSINNRARRVRVRVPLVSTTEAPPVLPEAPSTGARRTRVRLVSRQRQNGQGSGDSSSDAGFNPRGRGGDRNQLTRNENVDGGDRRDTGNGRTS